MTDTMIDARELEPGIFVITMQDRAGKNAFSPGFISALVDAFETVRVSTIYKVVILTGYDAYFCSGGTQESLIKIATGKAQFVDTNFYTLPLDCDIPVIAAMQGHGIGGGFVLGLFADQVILSRESVYTTNFMKYGFTPGMGATCVLPMKLGISLAEELLLWARNYRGGDLEKRGIPFPVLPRAAVFEHAMELAREISQRPRDSLITLKAHLVRELRELLPGVIEKELAMHEMTIHKPEVMDRIYSLFGK